MTAPVVDVAASARRLLNKTWDAYGSITATDEELKSIFAYVVARTSPVEVERVNAALGLARACIEELGMDEKKSPVFDRAAIRYLKAWPEVKP